MMRSTKESYRRRMGDRGQLLIQSSSSGVQQGDVAGIFSAGRECSLMRTPSPWEWSWSIVLSHPWLYRQILARSTPRNVLCVSLGFFPIPVQPPICLVPQPPSCFRFLLTKPLGGQGRGDSHAIRKVGKLIILYVYYLLIK